MAVRSRRCPFRRLRYVRRSRALFKRVRRYSRTLHFFAQQQIEVQEDRSHVLLPIQTFVIIRKDADRTKRLRMQPFCYRQANPENPNTTYYSDVIRIRSRFFERLPHYANLIPEPEEDEICCTCQFCYLGKLLFVISTIVSDLNETDPIDANEEMRSAAGSPADIEMVEPIKPHKAMYPNYDGHTEFMEAQEAGGGADLPVGSAFHPVDPEPARMEDAGVQELNGNEVEEPMVQDYAIPDVLRIPALPYLYNFNINRLRLNRDYAFEHLGYRYIHFRIMRFH